MLGSYRAVNVLAHFKNHVLKVAERCMTDTERGIVCTRDLIFAARLEDVAEIRGSDTHSAVDDCVALKVKELNGILQVFSCRLDRDCIRGDCNAVIDLGCPSGKQEVDRLYDFAAAELRHGLTGNDFSLIRVVVENSAEFLKISLGKCSRYGLGNAVRDTVRVTDTFPFNYLGALHLDRCLVYLLYIYVSCHLVIIPL